MPNVEDKGVKDAGADVLIKTLQGLAMLGAVVAVCLAVWAATSKRTAASGLPSYGQVPPFQLVEAGGKPFFSQNLAGKVWIASFVYTTCKESCPMLTAQVRRLAKSLPTGPGFALLSFSVDPKKDTPEVLERYARSNGGADDPRWHFLTGSVPQLKSLIEGGFKLSATAEEKASDTRSQPDIIHSTKLVLVDRHGVIRGYYDGLLGASIDDLRSDAESLARED